MRMILVAIFSILTLWTAIAFADAESAAVAARKAHWQAAVEEDA